MGVECEVCCSSAVSPGAGAGAVLLIAVLSSCMLGAEYLHTDVVKLVPVSTKMLAKFEVTAL